MIGTTVNHYKILEKLGEGGMGVVYKAEDTSLKRTVALKFLAFELTRDQEAKERFVHEAQAASALEHNNICSVHEIGETEDGRLFIAMSCYDGELLKSRMESGPLPVDLAIDIALQTAQGLAKAHSTGIIHRDVKPANIFITNDGTVKLLDFGLAKLSSQTRLTKTGKTVGTAAYMSPEQTRGDEVDQRTDIWSLGVVIYEMLSGKLPFPGDYEQAIIYGILNAEPEPLTALQAGIPLQLQRIVEKATAKNPDKRYQRAEEIIADLQSLKSEIKSGTARPPLFGFRLPRKKRAYMYGTVAVILSVLVAIQLFLPGGTGERINSIAVLPLVNLSGNPEQEYFADGMTDELITNLAKVRALKVISRTSVMQYKDTKKPLPQIARELNVDAVIEGSVLREGNEVRISAQLIQASTDQHMWADSYQRDLRNVLAMQEEIASAITERVRAAVTTTERARLASARAVNPKSYEAYLKGQFYISKMTEDGYEKGLAYLNQAVALDSTNPKAYAALALAYSIIGHERHPDAFDQARAATQKVEQLGGEPMADMYSAWSMKKLYSDWDYSGAEIDLKRAIELNPSFGEAQRDYSWYLYLIGKRDEALARMKTAQGVDPLNALFYADRAWQYWWMGKHDKAIEEAHKSLELDSNFNEGLAVLGYVYADKGMYDEALALHRKLAVIDPYWRWCLVTTLIKSGNEAEARKTLAKFLAEKPEPTGGWDGWFLTDIYAALGDKNSAFRWLELAYKGRMSFLPWINDNVLYKPLHGDPRFQAMVRRMNLPDRQMSSASSIFTQRFASGRVFAGTSTRGAR